MRVPGTRSARHFYSAAMQRPLALPHSLNVQQEKQLLTSQQFNDFYLHLLANEEKSPTYDVHGRGAGVIHKAGAHTRCYCTYHF